MYPIPKFADFSPTKCLEILRYFRDFMLNNENFGVKMKKKEDIKWVRLDKEYKSVKSIL